MKYRNTLASSSTSVVLVPIDAHSLEVNVGHQCTFNFYRHFISLRIPKWWVALLFVVVNCATMPSSSRWAYITCWSPVMTLPSIVELLLYYPNPLSRSLSPPPRVAITSGVVCILPCLVMLVAICLIQLPWLWPCYWSKRGLFPPTASWTYVGGVSKFTQPCHSRCVQDRLESLSPNFLH